MDRVSIHMNFNSWKKAVRWPLTSQIYSGWPMGCLFFILIIFMIKNSIQKSLCFNNVSKLESLWQADPFPKTFNSFILKDVSIIRGQPKAISERRWGRPFLFCN